MRQTTAVEPSRGDNEELVYSASDDYSSSSDGDEERVRSVVVVQRNSPPAKRPRRDPSPAGPQWVEKPAPKKGLGLDPILTRTGY